MSITIGTWSEPVEGRGVRQLWTKGERACDAKDRSNDAR
jgi:hypothetical protein